MKFGVCTLVKNENLYIREWIKHYINLGFDKIILYDNNDTNGEKLKSVIQDYINAGVIDTYKINDIPFSNNLQTYCYNDCLDRYKLKLNWIAFFDVDEFLELEEYKTIQQLFNNKHIYNDYDNIVVSWYTILDDGKMYYENKPVQERFSKHNIIKQYGQYQTMDHIVKSFVKTSGNAKFYNQNMHLAYSDKIINACGNIIYNINENTMGLQHCIHKTMYLKHYYTKSLTEFLYKKRYYHSIGDIFYKGSPYYNKENWSEEHEKVYQKFLKDNNIKASD